MQRFALDVLHHEERHRSVDHAVVGDRDNVLMTDRGGGQRFLPKTRNKLRVVSDEIGKNDLDRELGLEIRVPCLVNDAHAALTEPAFEVILAFEDRFAGDGVHRRHPIVRTGRDLIGVAVFTELTFFH